MTINFFFFNDTATTEIYTLSLHDALPIYSSAMFHMTSHLPSLSTPFAPAVRFIVQTANRPADRADRKSTPLTSSHHIISYAVFCLTKKQPDSSRSARSSPSFRCSTPTTPL